MADPDFEEFAEDCPYQVEGFCHRDPERAHDCELALCSRVDLSLRERAEILERTTPRRQGT